MNFEARRTRLQPLEAVAYLSAPLHLIVENEIHDGSFLLWMAKATGFNQLVSAYRQGLFIFRHAGGKDAFPSTAEVLSRGVLPQPGRHPERAMRLWAAALLDSDARYPGEKPNQAIVERTTPFVGFVHQLQKRAIENYIPDHYLQTYRKGSPHKRQVAALARLSPLQRCHFNMKEGFGAKLVGETSKAAFLNSGRVTAGEKELFASVSEADFVTLSSGFGEKLSDVFRANRTLPSSNDGAMTNTDDVLEMIRLFTDIMESI